MSVFSDRPVDVVGEFVARQGGAVVATVPAESGFPESAWVNVAVTESGQIVFATSRESRKAANLAEAAEVSLVSVDGAGHEIQLEARAHELQGEVAQAAQRALDVAHPGGGHDPAQVMLVGLDPVWARWVDASRQPPYGEETGF